jgi:IS30 family transposase
LPSRGRGNIDDRGISLQYPGFEPGVDQSEKRFVVDPTGQHPQEPLMVKDKDRVCIDERPVVVEQRSRVGDWEADTVVGRPGGAVLITLAERMTHQSILALSPDKSAKAVKKAIIRALQP